MPAGAKGKYARWLKPTKLEQVTNWVANGCADKALAERMGISRSTLYAWMERFPEFSDAIEKGRQLQLPAMENVFFNKARGGVVVTETVEEFRGTFKDGKPWDGVGMKRTVTKTLPPDTTALIFYLKNKAGYQSERRDEPDDSEALKNARELLAEVPSVIE